MKNASYFVIAEFEEYRHEFSPGFTSQPEELWVRKFSDYETVDVVYTPNRTCQRVPGKMKYGTRLPKCSECGYSLGDRRWNFCPQCGCEIVGEWPIKEVD